MPLLILGLAVFVASHMIRVVADDWRSDVIARIGEKRYKTSYSVISFLALGAMIWGYGAARTASPSIWEPSPAIYTATSALMLISMVMLAGFHAKQSHLSVGLRHPMLWSVVVLCAAHLLSNGRVVDILLFGSLMVWSVLNLISCYHRDHAQAVVYPAPRWRATAINLGLGLGFFIVFALLLHRLLIGVSPIPPA